MRFLCGVFLAVSLSFATFTITREEYELILKLREHTHEQQQVNTPLPDNLQAPVVLPQLQVPQEPMEPSKTPDEIDLFIMSCFEAAREQMAAESLTSRQEMGVVGYDGQDDANESRDHEDSGEFGCSVASGNGPSVVASAKTPLKTLKRKVQPGNNAEETQPKKKLKSDFTTKRNSNQIGKQFKFVHRISDSTVIYQHQYVCPSRIAVFNLAKHVTHEELFVGFRPFGFINRLWIATDRSDKHENMAFIEFSDESMAYDAVRQMAGATLDEQPIGVAMSPAFFDRSSRKVKITASKNTLNLGSKHLREHFSPLYLGSQYGFCVYAFQATVVGMTPFGFALFNDEEAAIKAKEDLLEKGFVVREDIC
jgi:hypothetical protein